MTDKSYLYTVIIKHRERYLPRVCKECPRDVRQVEATSIYEAARVLKQKVDNIVYQNKERVR